LALNIEGGSTNAVLVGAPHYDSGSDSGLVEVLNGYVIPEYHMIIIPIVFMLIIFAVWKRKRNISSSGENQSSHSVDGKGRDELNKR
jgi:hypothetical protein